MSKSNPALIHDWDDGATAQPTISIQDETLREGLGTLYLPSRQAVDCRSEMWAAPEPKAKPAAKSKVKAKAQAVSKTKPGPILPVPKPAPKPKAG